ncbi:hypothetical protein [Parabacteroides sp. Marseille-P3160]|uniref:hypothetical protein n=1 Tax=Parabacteroides sp. Marseille-P3160 TaxID=1917887 RepID=UPI001117E557|nr:hypothetical protein [Parabacteroides sp. Marseille-P3160]
MQVDLLKTRMYDLLIDSCTISHKEMQEAYAEFVEKEKVKVNMKFESDYLIVFRALNLTRIEFDSLELSPLYERGKKCV